MAPIFIAARAQGWFTAHGTRKSYPCDTTFSRAPWTMDLLRAARCDYDAKVAVERTQDEFGCGLEDHLPMGVE
jgi:hypothetical protein